MLKEGVFFKEIHLHASRVLASGLVEIGLMKGNIDEAVMAGAHAMFFPHGLGHMIGLDVHDMESLGENLVGYDEEIRRDEQFGLNALRLGKKLRTGFTVTIEPGIYFIPELIDDWKSNRKDLHDFLNFPEIINSEILVVSELRMNTLLLRLDLKS